jgi:hypothetical protein
MERRSLIQKGDNKGDKYSPAKKEETTSRRNFERDAAEAARNRTPQAGESSSFFGYFLKKLGIASSSSSDIKPASNLEVERIDLLNRTSKMTLPERREEHQKWLDSIESKEDRDNQAKEVLSVEYSTLIHNTMGGRRGTNMMSINERRVEHQKWLDSIPQEYRDAQSKMVISSELGNMLFDIKNMPDKEKTQQRQEWLDRVPKEYKDTLSKIVLSSDLESMLSITKNMPDEQTIQQRQDWLNNVPKEYKDAISSRVLSSEAEGMLSITKNMPDKQKAEREHKKWLKSVPKKYRAAMSNIIFYGQN